MTSPLMTDPVHDGMTDPTLVPGEDPGEWWCFFAHRRANTKISALPAIGRCHGTDVGVMQSRDDGRSWLYRGVLPLPIGPGHNTLWGPMAVRVGDEVHLFVTYLEGVPNDLAWDTHGRPSRWPREIHHLVGTDLWTWRSAGRLDLGTEHAVDPCVARLPDGGWAMWFKDEAAGGAVRRTTSADLRSWAPPQDVLDGWHESPVVKQLGDYYWLIAETRDGLRAYRSADAETWTEQGAFMDAAGTRPLDHGPARSPDLVAVGPDHGFLVYYAQSGTDAFGEPAPTSAQSSVLQAAHIAVRDGRLVCDRNLSLQLDLSGAIHPHHKELVR